jgi:hypothetical protein
MSTLGSKPFESGHASLKGIEKQADFSNMPQPLEEQAMASTTHQEER